MWMPLRASASGTMAPLPGTARDAVGSPGVRNGRLRWIIFEKPCGVKKSEGEGSKGKGFDRRR
jgi:hypothetical protein